MFKILLELTNFTFVWISRECGLLHVVVFIALSLQQLNGATFPGLLSLHLLSIQSV